MKFSLMSMVALLSLSLMACATTNKDNARLHPDPDGPTTTTRIQTGQVKSAKLPTGQSGQRAPISKATKMAVMGTTVPKKIVIPKGPMSPSTVCNKQGVAGGSVLLYPRVIPRNAPDNILKIADGLQARMKTLVQQTMPGKAMEVCPKPQRSCPQGGCLGMGVGVLLMHRGSGCAVVALISTPGRSVTKLVQWAGETELKQTRVEFREPPESQVIIDDFVPCDQVLDALKDKEAEILKSLKINAGMIKTP